MLTGHSCSAGAFSQRSLIGPAVVAAAFGQTTAFTYSPADPYTGEQVTFTTASCGTACRYQWADRPPGGGSWALHSGERLTPTLVFTFSGAGTKYVAVRKRTSSIAGWGPWTYVNGSVSRSSAAGILVRQGPRPVPTPTPTRPTPRLADSHADSRTNPYPYTDTDS